MQALKDSGVEKNTLVLFMTDNGPGGPRWNAGLRNRKGTLYDGGLRVPCYARLPGVLAAGKSFGGSAAHIDMMPTILSACGQAIPAGLDGMNLMPMLTGKESPVERTIFFQWHRGDEPELYRQFAVCGPTYKLVQNQAKNAKYELFDIRSDEFEQADLAGQLPVEVSLLKARYEEWFRDVGKAGYAPVRPIIGHEKENPVRLNRQELRGAGEQGWQPKADGYWSVAVARAGEYRLQVVGMAAGEDLKIEIGKITKDIKLPSAGVNAEATLRLEAGPADLKVLLGPGSAKYVTLEYLRP
jgi:hypothetical protein